jgi:hypothetical protein
MFPKHRTHLLHASGYNTVCCIVQLLRAVPTTHDDGEDPPLTVPAAQLLLAAAAAGKGPRPGPGEGPLSSRKPAGRQEARHTPLRMR